MATTTIPSDTVTTMLLLEKNSVRSVNGQAVRAATGAISTSDEVPVTAVARQALEQTLASLRGEQRAIPARLRVAREFGDMANNDEHLAIREEEAVLVTRIARLEDILSRATEVDHAGEEESVTIGSTVSVVDVDTRKRLDYVIGSAHGILSRGTVSALSPVGQALLGRRVGERVSVQLPHGRQRELELREVTNADRAA
jgi:transcription elongation factor GreA